MKEVEEVKKEFFSKTEEEWRSIFQARKEEIQEAVDVYLELKACYKNKEVNLLGWFFFAFYGMGGRLKKEKKKRFMEYFNKDLGESIDVKAIVNSINNDNTSSTYFSFVTKMLNLKDDNVYPIYDSRIAQKVFCCNKKSEMDLNNKNECYHRIKTLYDSIDEQDGSIKAFKFCFPRSKIIGKMRILDFILYNTVE